MWWRRFLIILGLIFKHFIAHSLIPNDKVAWWVLLCHLLLLRCLWQWTAVDITHIDDFILITQGLRVYYYHLLVIIIVWLWAQVIRVLTIVVQVVYLLQLLKCAHRVHRINIEYLCLILSLILVFSLFLRLSLCLMVLFLCVAYFIIIIVLITMDHAVEATLG